MSLSFVRKRRPHAARRVDFCSPSTFQTSLRRWQAEYKAQKAPAADRPSTSSQPTGAYRAASCIPAT